MLHNQYRFCGFHRTVPILVWDIENSKDYGIVFVPISRHLGGSLK